jgi:hypothetical protein
VNRARPLETLGRECRRVLDGYDAEAEGRRLARAARWAAAGTLVLPIGGVVVAAASVAGTETAAGALPGLLAAAGLAAAGLLSLPGLRRREKARLEEAVTGLRQGLTTALRAGFERELQASQKRVKDVVAPFGGFVRAAGEQLHALSDELEQHRRELTALRARIEALR